MNRKTASPAVIALVVVLALTALRWSTAAYLSDTRSPLAKSIGIVNKSGTTLTSFHLTAGEKSSDFVQMPPGMTSAYVYGIGKVRGTLTANLATGQPIGPINLEINLGLLDHMRVITIHPGGRLELAGAIRQLD